MKKGFDYVISLFSPNSRYTMEEIISLCNKDGFSDDTSICKIVEELKIKGIIYQKRDNTFTLFPNDLILGILNVEDGINCVVNDDAMYVVNDDDLNDALNGDIVTMRNSNGKCKIDSIVKRKDGLVTVEVVRKNGEVYLTPKDANINHRIIINSISLNSFVDGDLLLVKISESLENNCYYAGLVKRLGHVSDPDYDLTVIAKENSIDIDFSKQAIEEAEEIPNEVTVEDAKNRVDLTNELIFSIDGEHTKDRDDAISLSLDNDGNYILGVHIADVSHYVHPGMKLWDEAMKRSTSVYLANSVIPMLPHKLSNGICSLNPNVKRLTFSCIAKISPKGHIIDYKFVDAMIRSRRALTYDEANEIIDGKELFRDRELTLTLRLMNQLSNILEHAKYKRGYIDLGCNDVIVDVDNDNNVDLRLRNRTKSELLIANFMQIASQCAADYVSLPAPYRVHDKPEIDDMLYAFETLHQTGIKVTEVDDVINPRTIQRVLKQLRDTPDRDIAASIILRAMKPARYSPHNSGHYGLGLEKYSQFTSPIRRATDLMMHVVIRDERALSLDGEPTFSMEEMNDFCRHATTKEGNAVIAQREAIQLEMKRYIEDHYEEKFLAMVTFVNASGIYIKTTQGIEGKLLPEDIEGDSFRYDYKYGVYRGKKTGYRIGIGTELVLTPLDVHNDYKNINFAITDNDLMALKKRKH